MLNFGTAVGVEMFCVFAEQISTFCEDKLKQNAEVWQKICVLIEELNKTIDKFPIRLKF